MRCSFVVQKGLHQACPRILVSRVRQGFRHGRRTALLLSGDAKHSTHAICQKENSQMYSSDPLEPGRPYPNLSGKYRLGDQTVARGLKSGSQKVE